VKTRCKFEQCKQIQTQGKTDKINIGDALSGRVGGSKTLFSQEIFITSVDDLKLKFEFRKQLKKMPFLENILSSTS
jgi:hypothetical protein